MRTCVAIGAHTRALNAARDTDTSILARLRFGAGWCIADVLHGYSDEEDREKDGEHDEDEQEDAEEDEPFSGYATALPLHTFGIVVVRAKRLSVAWGGT